MNTINIVTTSLLVLWFGLGALAFVIANAKTNHFDQFHPLEKSTIIPLVYMITGPVGLGSILIYLKDVKNGK